MISKSFGDRLLGVYGATARRLPFKLPPIGYFLYITGTCNLDCVYCWQREQQAAGDKVDSAKSPLSPAEWARVVEQLPRFSFIGVSGGESTISPAFRSVLGAAGGRPVTVNTNGVVMRDEDIALLSARPVMNVSISLDGFADVHDVTRNRKGLFDKTVANIQRLRAARRGALPRLTIKVVLTDELLPRIQEFHRFCEVELGAEALNVSLQKTGDHNQYSLIHGADMAEVFGARTYLHPYADKVGLAAAMKDLLRVSQDSRCKVVYYPAMTTAEQIDIFLAADGRGCYRPCDLPRAMVAVLPDGQVIPCQSLRLGNVRDHGLRVLDVLRSGPYREVCDRISGFGSRLPDSCNVCCFSRVA